MIGPDLSWDVLAHALPGIHNCVWVALALENEVSEHNALCQSNMISNGHDIDHHFYSVSRWGTNSLTLT